MQAYAQSSPDYLSFFPVVPLRLALTSPTIPLGDLYSNKANRLKPSLAGLVLILKYAEVVHFELNGLRKQIKLILKHSKNKF